MDFPRPASQQRDERKAEKRYPSVLQGDQTVRERRLVATHVQTGFLRRLKVTTRKGTRRVLLVAAAFLFASPAIAAQGRPSGGGQRGQKPATAGQQQGQANQQQGGQGTRQRIQATDQQRDQLRTCTQTTDRIREQARDMDRLARSSTFDAGKVRQQRDQIRDQLRTMEQEHQRLMNGMSEDQKQALRTRTEQMNQIRERVNNQLGRLDEELGKPNPNAKQVSKTAEQISREMNQWKSQYRAMESEMGVKP
jgi:hypothetical protein